MAGQRFAYCWFLRIEVPHLIGMLSENQVGIAERVVELQMYPKIPMFSSDVNN
jgi:hypothetical protein